MAVELVLLAVPPAPPSSRGRGAAEGVARAGGLGHGARAHAALEHDVLHLLLLQASGRELSRTRCGVQRVSDAQN